MNVIPSFRTSRLLIRRESVNDVTDLYFKIYKDYNSYKLYDPIFVSNVEQLQFKINQQDSFNNGIYNFKWTIIEKNTNEIIGTIHLHNRDVVHNNVKLGYIISPFYQNKGYCSEAVMKIIDFAFNDLLVNRIEAEVVLTNIPSIRVLEKCGFNYEYEKQSLYYLENKYYSVKGYVKFNEKQNMKM